MNQLMLSTEDTRVNNRNLRQLNLGEEAHERVAQIKDNPEMRAKMKRCGVDGSDYTKVIGQLIFEMQARFHRTFE